MFDNNITLWPVMLQCEPHLASYFDLLSELNSYHMAQNSSPWAFSFGIIKRLQEKTVSLLCFLFIISCSRHWAVLLDAVKCASGVLWNSVAPDTAGALLLTPDPWKVCSVLPLGLMDEAESIDAPSPAALIRLSLFLSILLLGLIDSLQCLWPASLISEATMWDYQYVCK